VLSAKRTWKRVSLFAFFAYRRSKGTGRQCLLTLRSGRLVVVTSLTRPVSFPRCHSERSEESASQYGYGLPRRPFGLLAMTRKFGRHRICRGRSQDRPVGRMWASAPTQYGFCQCPLIAAQPPKGLGGWGFIRKKLKINCLTWPLGSSDCSTVNSNGGIRTVKRSLKRCCIVTNDYNGTALPSCR